MLHPLLQEMFKMPSLCMKNTAEKRCLQSCQFPHRHKLSASRSHSDTVAVVLSGFKQEGLAVASIARDVVV